MLLSEEQLIARIRQKQEWRQRWRKSVGFAIVLIGLAVIVIAFAAIQHLQYDIVKIPPATQSNNARTAHDASRSYVLGYVFGIMNGFGIFFGMIICMEGVILMTNPCWKERLILKLWDERGSSNRLH